MAILRPLLRNLKHGVQDRLSEYSNSKLGRSTASTSVDGTQASEYYAYDNEDTITLTLVTTPAQKKPSKSQQSTLSPTWDTDMEMQRAQV
jgi:hypothetical protein